MNKQAFQFVKILGCALVFLCAATIQSKAGGGGGGGGGRGGGGGGTTGGFGGFGGFGGTTGGTTTAARSTTTSSSSSQYNNNGQVGQAQISVDPDTHNLVVIADGETLAQIKEVLRNLDAAKPQVLIKVVFMEVAHNGSSSIGIDGGYAQQGGHNTYLTSGDMFGLSPIGSVVTNFNALGQPFSSALSPGTSPGGVYTAVVGTDFQATLKAIAQAGKAEVLSRPSILAEDGQPAQIVVGQQIYLPSGVSFNTVGTTGTTFPTINGSYQNVGIILNVTPFIQGNGLVQMILQPQTSTIDTSSTGQVIAGGSLFSTPIYAPNINIRSANTVVITPDGQPVVIGGLMGDMKSSSESKVPFLGDIPLLGNLFKLKNKAGSKQELLIFLTPHIVNQPTDLPVVSGNETRQSTLITNNISREDIERFLEQVPDKKK